MADHNIDNNPHSYDTIDQWSCPICYKTISPSRAPIYNPSNCSCAEAAGTYAHGYNQTFHPLSPSNYHVPASNASSNLSVPSPEGPEREDPNMHPTLIGTGGNTFLPLAPEPGYNESVHRNSSSFHDNLPYSLQEFLKSPEYEYHHQQQPRLSPDDSAVFSPSSSSGREASGSRVQQPMMQFISQGVHLQAQAGKRRIDGSSARSGRSGPSSWSASEGGKWNWVVDDITGMGAWMDGEGNVYVGEGGGYPLNMSGFTD